VSAGLDLVQPQNTNAAVARIKLAALRFIASPLVVHFGVGIT
jgi:hypothetical protein